MLNTKRFIKPKNYNDIINHLLKITPVLWKCPMAYFLYNFAYRPFFSSDVFLIN